MKVVLSSAAHILNKKQCTIFSIDIWPGDASYFITGGQDGSVRAWRVFGGKTTEEGSFSKHAGAVLCTRFSQDGNMLATASDDGNVIVWGVTKTENAFKLHTKKRLSDHKSDVSSIAWGRKYLATGGYDGSVFVYDRESFRLVTRLEKHEKGCKGISFSPGSGYISTYGDEGELFLYNKLLKKIASTKKPFKGVQMESFFARMSWSPDGKYIACGLAFFEGQDAVSLLTPSLTRNYTLIGHAAPVETVAFNPWLWRSAGASSYILATGSQDRSVAIWSSSSSKPLILLKEVSEQPIMDMQWAPEGRVLMGCTYDGSVFRLEFEEKELGEPVAPAVEEDVVLPYAREFVDAEKGEKFPSPPGEAQSEGGEKSEEKSQKTPSEEPKKKKIIPRFIAPLEEPSKTGVVKGPRVVLFTQACTDKSPEVLPGRCIAHMETHAKGVKYEISVKAEKTLLSTRRNGREWFSTAGHAIKMVGADGSLLAIVSAEGARAGKMDTLWIYCLERGVLLLPGIPFREIVSVDVKGRRVLAVAFGEFRVIDVDLHTTVEGCVVGHSGIVNILLSDVYFLLALYEDGTTQYYDPGMKMWFVLEMNSPSAYCETYLGDGEKDCTFEFLENRCLAGLLHGDWDLVDDSLEKIIGTAARSEESAPGLLNRVNAVIDQVVGAQNWPQEKALLVCNLLVKHADTEEFQKYAHTKTREIRERAGLP
ncbi:protein HIRA/HIR1 [Nematocida major]|uniref:protein HIRA/HIR1 n=1 Tax=Nematocida major TaxID=1912982 RepID=UPI002007E5BB|nr:protein HIRA/HIR1 [Nematocida major]KAH9387302.1 protein HIRA/HIR1 [Nematocida major]